MGKRGLRRAQQGQGRAGWQGEWSGSWLAERLRTRSRAAQGAGAGPSPALGLGPSLRVSGEWLLRKHCRTCTRLPDLLALLPPPRLWRALDHRQGLPITEE